MSEKEVLEALQEAKEIEEDIATESAETEEIEDSSLTAEVKVGVAEDTVVPVTTYLAQIVNCQNVYVREKPEKGSKPLTILPAGSEVYVHTDEETEDFYKIHSVFGGVDGYCMKDFVDVIEGDWR